MDRASKPYSLASFLSFFSDNFAVLFIGLLFLLGGFFTGSLWTENQMLKKGVGTAGTQVAQGGTAPTDTQPAAEGPTLAQLTSIPPVTDEDYIRGNKNAKITLVEFSDFECPFCGRFHPTMNQVLKEYGDNVKWVFRQYPLSFHPNAQKAAEASECVGKQKGDDGFWAYADSVFAVNEKSGSITPEAIEAGAQAAGVDMTAFKQCLESGEMAAKVKAQMDAGTAAGVTGTPGTIILTQDGKAELIPGAYSFEQIKPILDKYL